MGYHTNYQLGTYSSKMDISEILSTVLPDEFTGLHYAIDENGDFYDSVNWFSHEEDMKELSLKFPDVVFELNGEGENNGDMWVKYFKNGKMQACYAQISYDKYDEQKLE